MTDLNKDLYKQYLAILEERDRAVEESGFLYDALLDILDVEAGWTIFKTRKEKLKAIKRKALEAIKKVNSA